MAESAMIQIMQQLQIENQAIMRALSEQQEQLNQQQEASHQQMRRLEAMVVNIAQQSSGAVLQYEHQAERAQGVIAEALPAVLQDEHLAEEAQDVIVGTLPLFALTDSPTGKAYSPADEEETYREWARSAPSVAADSPPDEEASHEGIDLAPTDAAETSAQRRRRHKLEDANYISTRANANSKRMPRRKAFNVFQATTAPTWHAAKRETLSWKEQASLERETLLWYEQTADRAKRPRTTSKFPLAPWAGASSSSGSTGPIPPVFGPPPEPPPGRERTRSPEESAEFDPEQYLDARSSSAQFSLVGCRRLRSWDNERRKLSRELEDVETQEQTEALDKGS